MQALLMLMRFFWPLLSNKTRTNRQAAPHLQRCISCRWHVVLGLSCVIAADLRTQAGKIRAQKPKQREGMCGWSMCLVFFFFLASLSSFLFWCGHASVLALGSRFRPGCSFRPGCIHHFSLFRSPSRPFGCSGLLPLFSLLIWFCLLVFPLSSLSFVAFPLESIVFG